MHNALSRSAALSFALVAMLLRAFLPDGWMPSAQASDSPFTICSVQPISQTGKVPQGDGHTHLPCAFAAASTLATPTFVALSFGAISAGWRIETDFTSDQPDSDRPHQPYIARAPPFFA